MSDDVIKKLVEENFRIKRTLCTALAWIVGSANSPLSVNELKELYEMLEPAPTDG